MISLFSIERATRILDRCRRQLYRRPWRHMGDGSLRGKQEEREFLQATERLSRAAMIAERAIESRDGREQK